MNKIKPYVKKNIICARASNYTYTMTNAQYSGFLGASILSNSIVGLLDMINQIAFYEVNPELISKKYGNYQDTSTRLYTKLGKSITGSTISFGAPFL